ncbi:MAG: radical SAM protein [Pedobacter sp.]
MKVAFVSPEYYDIAHFGVKRKEIPPFGVLYLAAVVENLGIEVVIHRVSNENYSLDLTDFDVVGFTISSSIVYPLIKKVRQHSTFNNESLLMAGGIHATIYPEEVLNELELDVVCVGESEETIREIISNFESRDFAGVSGLVYKKVATVVNTGLRPLICDLDQIPFPARHLMPIEDIFMSDRLSSTNFRIAHLLCSRGCPYHCFFCANQEHSIRYRSGKNIRKELELLVSTYKIEGFCITDDNFIVNKVNIKNICKEIAPLNLRWSSLSRVNTVDIPTLETIRDSGCFELKYGIESGSQRMLDLMNKQVTLDQIRKAINETYSVGIKIKAFIIHGFPGENIESTNDTIQLLDELKDKIERISLFRFAPLPGSHVHSHYKDYKIILPDNYEDVYIYNNDKKWWGNENDHVELQSAYTILENYVKDIWERF